VELPLYRKVDALMDACVDGSEADHPFEYAQQLRRFCHVRAVHLCRWRRVSPFKQHLVRGARAEVREGTGLLVVV
jgi:hypothetical protein